MINGLVEAVSGFSIAVVTAISATAVARSSSKVQRDETRRASWETQFENLSDEVERMGEKIEALEVKLDNSTRLNRLAVNFIDGIGIDLAAGRMVRSPEGELAVVVDMAAWRKYMENNTRSE